MKQPSNLKPEVLKIYRINFNRSKNGKLTNMFNHLKYRIKNPTVNGRTFESL